MKASDLELAIFKGVFKAALVWVIVSAVSAVIAISAGNAEAIGVGLFIFIPIAILVAYKALKPKGDDDR